MSTDAAPTIIEFLLARIAEDEREATERGAEPWYDGGWPKEHVARLLKDCAAKREIAVECKPGTLDDLTCSEDESPAPMWVARSLAVVYAAHPDYKQEWAPRG